MQKDSVVKAPPRPRIADVAEAAGVSVPTVSKVLNGRPHVSPSTRRRVDAVLKEMGYHKPPRDTSTARLMQLVVNNFDSPWVLQILDGAEAAANRHGYDLLCLRAENASAGAWRKLRQPSVNQLAGVLLLAPHIGSDLVPTLNGLHIPAVALDPQGTEATGIPSVSAANFTGATSAVEHLISLGHQRIGMITGGGSGSVRSRARYAAYAAALQGAGLPADPSLVRDGDFSLEAGYRLGRDLLGMDQPPTAVFAGNDLQALGIISAATGQGLRVPQDLSVIGFDDIAQAQLASPPLTTIRQPLEQMAATAVRMLLDLIQGDQGGPVALELATELVVRESTDVPAVRAG